MVNFHHHVIVNQRSINIWKVQKAPVGDIRVGQTVWFESEIFVTGKSIERDLGGGQTVGVKQYSGEVLGVNGWEKIWIRFSVGSDGQEDFQLWTPICWTTLGFTLRVRHYLLHHQLVDTIPLVGVGHCFAWQGTRPFGCQVPGCYKGLNILQSITQ
jgi:hypothetical protein